MCARGAQSTMRHSASEEDRGYEVGGTVRDRSPLVESRDLCSC
jgi:hypothetical protein